MIINTLIDICAIPVLLVAMVVAVVIAARGVVWGLEKKANLEYIRASRRVELEQRRADMALVQLNPTRPVIARAQLETGAYDPAMLAMAICYLETLQPVRPAPSHFHYEAPPAQNAPQIEQSATLPLPAAATDFWSLYTAGQLPDKDLLLGYDMLDNQPVIAGWKDLYSALIGGLPGSGKSTLMRSILAQSAIQGSRFLVLDKHCSAGEESTGASLLPLRHLMLSDVAATDRQMLDAILYALEIGRRRLTGKDADRSPLIVVVDECTALFARSDIAAKLGTLLAEISQETRKVGLFAMCLGHNFDGRIMDTTIRNSFVSMISCRARRDVARVMSGNNEFAKVAETLRVGQAVWMSPNGDMTRISVPNTTAKHLALVAQTIDGSATRVEDDGGKVVYTPVNHAGFNGGDKPPGNHLKTTNKPPDATERRAVDLFLGGSTLSEIVRDLHGATTGKPYTDAMRMVQDVIRSALKGGNGG